MEMKVSIIIPAYNIEAYIGRCLDSVLKQSYRNIEVIVVNDGSTDGTEKVINQYAQMDSRIIAIHKVNEGVTKARLYGVKQATGDYIGFVDGDDYIEPYMYEHLLHNAQKYGADISHCGYQMVFPDGHIDYYYNTGRLVQQNQSLGLKDLVSGVFIEPGLVSKLFRKPLFDNIMQDERIDTSIKINEDLLMNFYLFREAKISIYEDICPYHYILRKSSTATSKLNENKLKDPLRVLKIIYSEAEGEIQYIVIEKIVRQMIRIATMPLENQRELIYSYRKQVRIQLRKNVLRILGIADVSIKIKAMAIWVSIFPDSYQLVHSIYSKVTGLDKKYNVE